MYLCISVTGLRLKYTGLFSDTCYIDASNKMSNVYGIELLVFQCHSIGSYVMTDLLLHLFMETSLLNYSSQGVSTLSGLSYTDMQHALAF